MTYHPKQPSLILNYPFGDKLKKNDQNISKDGSLVLSLFPIILAIIIAVSIFVLKDSLPPNLPLFYSLPWGEAQLATIYQLLIIPAVFLCISLINLIFFLQLSSDYLIFKRILSLSSVIISLILTAGFLQVLSIFL